MSLVEKLCEEIGVEIDKEWLGSDGFGYIIKSNGDITIRNTDDNYYRVVAGEVYERLIKRELKPIWKPKVGETYYTADPLVIDGDFYSHITWADVYYDRELFNRGLVFKTKDQAVEAAKKMLDSIK